MGSILTDPDANRIFTYNAHAVKQYLLHTTKASDAKGKFVVVDAPDGYGKGSVIRALVELEQKDHRAVFDSISFSRAYEKGLPDLADFWNPPHVHYHTVVTEEPSYSGIGKSIREEVIKRGTGRHYSTIEQVHGFSLDRLIQMQKVVIPALQNGLNVIQSRCWLSTLNYQTTFAEMMKEDIERVKEAVFDKDGTRIELYEYAPDLLIIPVITVDEAMRRLGFRDHVAKEDEAIYETREFQEKVRAGYMDPDLVGYFAKRGTKVVYLDNSGTRDETILKTVKIYKDFLAEREKK